MSCGLRLGAGVTLSTEGGARMVLPWGFLDEAARLALALASNAAMVRIAEDGFMGTTFSW